MNKNYKHSEIIGPFDAPKYSYARVNGCQVPYIKLLPGKNENDGKIEIVLDDRMSYIIDDTHIDVVLALVANAMAVAAGYPCMGASEKINPFAVKLSELP